MKKTKMIILGFLWDVSEGFVRNFGIRLPASIAIYIFDGMMGQKGKFIKREDNDDEK